MVRFREKGIAKEKFYAAKNPIKIFDINVHNIVVSKLVETILSISKYLIGIQFDKAVRLLVLTTPKMSAYVKAFKVEDKINKLMSFHIDDDPVSNDPSTIAYCPDKYTTYKMCDEAVDDSVAVLKLSRLVCFK